MKIIYIISLIGIYALGQFEALNAKGLDKTDIISKTWDEIKKAYEWHQEDKQLQKASSIEITKRASKLHDDLLSKYGTELDCFFKQQYAQNEKTLLDETKQLFAHFEKRAQENGHSIDYIRELKDDCKKIGQFVERLEAAKKTAKIQLESKDLEKDAKILATSPRELRREYQEMIKQATTLQKNLLQLANGLKAFKKDSIFYLEKDEKMRGISLDTLDRIQGQISTKEAADEKFAEGIKKLIFIRAQFLDPSYSRIFKIPKGSRLVTHFQALKNYLAEKKRLLSQGLKAALTRSSAHTTGTQQKVLGFSPQHHPAMLQQQHSKK